MSFGVCNADVDIPDSPLRQEKDSTECPTTRNRGNPHGRTGRTPLLVKPQSICVQIHPAAPAGCAAAEGFSPYSHQPHDSGPIQWARGDVAARPLDRTRVMRLVRIGECYVKTLPYRKSPTDCFWRVLLGGLSACCTPTHAQAPVHV